MSATAAARSASLQRDEHDHESALRSLRRGLGHAPEFFDGLWLTILLAGASTLGKVVVPIAVQRVIDTGIVAPETPDIGVVVRATVLAAVVLLVTVVCQIIMNRRLFRASETGLAALRRRAFTHIHNLSLLTQGTERRGSLVSRVTSDIDTVTQFMSFGGVMLLVMTFQIVVATVVMALYSVPLTVVVWLCIGPTLLVMGAVQRRVRAAYQKVRTAVGGMLGTVSEDLVGAATIRAYGIGPRTRADMDTAVRGVRHAQTRVLPPQATSFFLSESADGLTTGAVVAVGVLIGTRFDALTVGELIAFVFLISLFTQPVRMGIEMLNEAQNAVAGFRRVLGVLDTPADVADPAGVTDRATGAVLAAADPDAREIPPGPIGLEAEHLTFAYPGGPDVLHDVTVSVPAGSHVAIVGETGSGKTTFAKLLTRLMDPKAGRVTVGGVDLRRIPFSSLRARVVMVPQDGFLFDTTVAGNLAYGRPDTTEDDMTRALDELGLADWLDGLPLGLETPVGQRGEALSAGERQLVALARAYVADPDVIVLDEATSAVDPAADVRLQQALESFARGRTTVTIAHRLSTAETADQILVFDQGVLAERGRHADLVDVPGGIYAGLHRSWVAHRGA